MDTPTDAQVKSYIDSVPGLRREWGIPKAERAGTIAFGIMSVLLIAIAVGAVAYFMRVDMEIAFKNASGLIIVLVLAYVVSGVRFFQLRAERRDLEEFRKELAKRLTGNPQTDVEEQQQVEASFRWNSLHYRTIARMIGITGLIILTINTYQSGTIDYARMLLFDGAILVYLTGAFWNNFAFKADLLTVELQERSRATIRWQTEHPGEAQAQIGEQEPDKLPEHGAHSKDDDSTGA